MFFLFHKLSVVLPRKKWKKAMRARFTEARSEKHEAKFFSNKVLFSIKRRNIKYA